MWLPNSSFFCLTKSELNLYFEGVKLISKRNRMPLLVLRVRDVWGGGGCCLSREMAGP